MTSTMEPTQRQAAPFQTYEERLRTLSEASVEQHFDAFADIDWDHPDYAIDPTDERWILPDVDVLGRHAWYRSLPKDEQIRVGLYRQANITKVGLQFEQILIAGLMNYAYGLPNGSPEFRYSTHEATEECHHTQMFQEFVNRTGQDVGGGSKAFQRVSPILPLAARLVPFGFFFGVLAGEEPIDHVQKTILRAGDDMHPLLQRIMQIHVAEEARHIGFAHQYLEHKAPRLKRHERAVLSVAVPLDHALALRRDRGADQAGPARHGHPGLGHEGALLGQPGVAEVPARPLRRRPDARRGDRHDEQGLAPGLEVDEDRRPHLALPQPARLRSGLRRRRSP